MSRAFLRLRSVNGNSRSPQDKGNSRHPAGVSILAAPAVPVETSTVTFPTAPAFTVVVAGLNTHFAYAGNEPQANVKVPWTPFTGFIVSAKFAICPAETVWLLDPEIAEVKSKPVPERGTADWRSPRHPRLQSVRPSQAR